MSHVQGKSCRCGGVHTQPQTRNTLIDMQTSGVQFLFLDLLALFSLFCPLAEASPPFFGASGCKDNKNALYSAKTIKYFKKKPNKNALLLIFMSSYSAKTTNYSKKKPDLAIYLCGFPIQHSLHYLSLSSILRSSSFEIFSLIISMSSSLLTS